MSKNVRFFGVALLIVTLILVAGAIFYKKQNEKIPDLRVAQILKLRDIYNNPVKDIKTDYVIINFWASWCPPCVEETPSLIRFTERHSKSFTLLALSQDTTKKEIDEFIKTFPALKSEFITIIHDDSQSAARSFKVFKLPETFVYSISQNKFFQFSGSTNWDMPEVIQALEKYYNAKIN